MLRLFSNNIYTSHILNTTHTVVACEVKLVLFQDGGVQITWDNPSELEEYINKLQAAAERLTSENRRLRHCHAVLVDKVSICRCTITIGPSLKSICLGVILRS